MGMVSWPSCARSSYVIVGAFVIGAIFTPPDVISQFMLAMPMWVLYELGIVVAALITKPKPEAEADYTPMAESEMDAELDRIEASQIESEPRDQNDAPGGAHRAAVHQSGAIKRLTHSLSFKNSHLSSRNAACLSKPAFNSGWGMEALKSGSDVLFVLLAASWYWPCMQGLPFWSSHGAQEEPGQCPGQDPHRFLGIHIAYFFIGYSVAYGVSFFSSAVLAAQNAMPWSSSFPADLRRGDSCHRVGALPSAPASIRNSRPPSRWWGWSTLL